MFIFIIKLILGASLILIGMKFFKQAAISKKWSDKLKGYGSFFILIFSGISMYLGFPIKTDDILEGAYHFFVGLIVIPSVVAVLLGLLIEKWALWQLSKEKTTNTINQEENQEVPAKKATIDSVEAEIAEIQDKFEAWFINQEAYLRRIEMKEDFFILKNSKI